MHIIIVFMSVYLPAKATDMNKDWISYTYSVLCTPLVFAWLSTCVNALGRNIIQMKRANILINV